MSKLTPEQAEAVFEAVKHGDADHQAWLRDKLTSLTAPAVTPALPEQVQEIEKRHAEDDDRAVEYCERWRDTEQPYQSLRDAHADRATLLALLKAQRPLVSRDDLANWFFNCLQLGDGKSQINADALLASGLLRRALSTVGLKAFLDAWFAKYLGNATAHVPEATEWLAQALSDAQGER